MKNALVVQGMRRTLWNNDSPELPYTSPGSECRDLISGE
jgi:hypothetical protein